MNRCFLPRRGLWLIILQRGETDFFSGEPLRALSTLVFSDNVDLQRSASLTFAEITERGTFEKGNWASSSCEDLHQDEMALVEKVISEP